ncbi:PAS domain-containing protein [Vreelandella andesensis]|uniref:PAS domain-containing protein n=1 Tax=Vreelandella andesensis TaxID=447567 RepID=A0A3S0W8Q2_9GAMM|nr:PAS domain-containing protein [Halomonas andesensis]RUR34821.1 PAS domain-containing protein [Halomonas andesensis]
MLFIPDKDTGVIPHVLTKILDTCVNGVTLSDPDQPDSPIIYANEIFEHMTGYSQDEILGRNCRFLQGEDRDQPELDKIRAALKVHDSVEVTLRNYRKDGTLFHNRLMIQPLHDTSGNLIYYLGVQYDVSELVNARAEIERLENILKTSPAD